MAAVIPNEGKLQFLKQGLGAAPIETLILKLFCNNYTPVAGSTAAAFTEASGAGYASKSLTAANWTYAGTTTQTASYPVQTWTFTGALTTNATIYGYYLVGATSGKVYCAELLAAPFTPANNGDNLSVTPHYSQA